MPPTLWLTDVTSAAKAAIAAAAGLQVCHITSGAIVTGTTSRLTGWWRPLQLPSTGVRTETLESNPSPRQRISKPKIGKPRRSKGGASKGETKDLSNYSDHMSSTLKTQ